MEVKKTVSFRLPRQSRPGRTQEKTMSRPVIFLLSGLVFAAQAHAQVAPVASTAGTMVIVPATAEVKHANDEAILTLSVEEFDKDKAAAASRVNQKMKQGTEIVKREDPQAQLKTQGYYSYPVYPDNQPPMPPQPLTRAQPKPVPIGWRIGQYLEVRTRNLAGLQKTAGAAQKVMAISNLQFGLSPETTRQLDDQRIAATYRNLNERVASIARAMGRNVAEAVIETVDFEGSGHYAGQPAPQSMVMVSGARRKAAEDVAEPSFEPGESVLQMRLVGKVKFK
jgi:predicted secreted protein